MALYELKNEQIAITVDSHGAELKSLKKLADDQEYMWCGDAKFWGRTSPVLFPFVGGLKNKEYRFEGKTYSMTQHGFARDTEFEQIAAGEDFVTYRLCADEESKKKYPFDFVLEITHRLENNRLSVEWNVKNVDDKEMYFTIGGHPAFNVNILPDTDFEDYSLVFKEGIETLSYILIDAENGTALTDKT